MGEVEVRGLTRMTPAKSPFTPHNNVGGNLWYWADLPSMTASAFPGGSVAALPFVLEADAEPLPPGGLPRGGVTRLALPNRHLEYALTWYGLALSLVAIYLAFAIPRLRASHRL
jgi:surfeit locus 1 family protein